MSNPLTAYVPGISTPRWREARMVLSGGFLFAVAVIVVVWAPFLQADNLVTSLEKLISVSDGFRTAGIAVLTVVASSVLVLRITYALVDRRELDGAAHAEAEQRFSTIATVCCLFAVPFATFAIPSTLIRLDRIGECVAIVGVTGLSMLFAFGAGSSWAPDARKQRAATLSGLFGHPVGVRLAG